MIQRRKQREPHLAIRHGALPRGGAIGLDLGATMVRAAALEAAGDTDAPHGIAARQLGAVALPEGAVIGGIVQDPAAVTLAVKELVRRYRLRGRKVVLGINTPQVVVRHLELPAMSADALQQALPYQARTVLPFPVADAVLDFRPLPTARARGRHGLAASGPSGGTAAGGTAADGAAADGASADGAAMMAGLLMAAPKAPVLAAVRAVERGGVSVARVDLSSLGLLRAVGTAGTATEALVDIGSDLTTIVIHRFGVPQVVRVVSFGGRQVTERIADGLGYSYADAEAAKRQTGVMGESDAAQLVQAEIRSLRSEIRTSLQFFASTIGGTVERVLITGGTAALPGLTELLSADLALPVDTVGALRNLAGGSGVGGSRVGGSVGGGSVGGGSVGGGSESGGNAADGWANAVGTASTVHAASAVSVGLALGCAA